MMMSMEWVMCRERNPRRGGKPCNRMLNHDGSHSVVSRTGSIGDTWRKGDRPRVPFCIITEEAELV